MSNVKRAGPLDTTNVAAVAMIQLGWLEHDTITGDQFIFKMFVRQASEDATLRSAAFPMGLLAVHMEQRISMHAERSGCCADTAALA